MRSRIRVEVQISVFVGVWSWVAQGRGRSKAISRSNRRNRIATKKNRIEKGRRAEPSGSNPHSYGESFSGSGFIWASKKFSVVRMMLRVRDKVIIKVIMFIALLWG